MRKDEVGRWCWLGRKRGTEVFGSALGALGIFMHVTNKFSMWPAEYRNVIYIFMQ
jgi:hypothetical protein